MCQNERGKYNTVESEREWKLNWWTRLVLVPEDASIKYMQTNRFAIQAIYFEAKEMRGKHILKMATPNNKTTHKQLLILCQGSLQLWLHRSHCIEREKMPHHCAHIPINAQMGFYSGSIDNFICRCDRVFFVFQDELDICRLSSHLVARINSNMQWKGIRLFASSTCVCVCMENVLIPPKKASNMCILDST